MDELDCDESSSQVQVYGGGSSFARVSMMTK